MSKFYEYRCPECEREITPHWAKYHHYNCPICNVKLIITEVDETEISQRRAHHE